MPLLRRPSTWAWPLLLFPVSAAADDQAAHVQEERLEDLRLEDLLTMDVETASKFAQPVSLAPGIVSVVTPEEVRRFGWLSLNDVLYALPGFAPSRDFERRTVSARGQYEGWNNNHLLMLVDGIPANDNIYGSAYTWEVMPLYLADRVEVIRGPGSALYGTNATNGVVHVRTYSPGVLETVGRARVLLGTAGTRFLDVMAGHGTEDVSALVSYSQFGTDGEEYDSPDASLRRDASGALARFRVQDSRASSSFFGKLESRKLLEGLSLQVLHQQWNFETAYGWLWNIPEVPDQMHEGRQLVTLAYRTPRTAQGPLTQEYAARFQRHQVAWNVRYFPLGTPGYPAGLTETLQTQTDSLFLRAQASVGLPLELNVLAGAESTVFFYAGDARHDSNADLSGTFEAFPDGGSRPLPPFLELIAGHPVYNLGGFLQLTSGRLLGPQLTATLGGRYDTQFFNYTDLQADRQVRRKSFQQFSPRVALVYTPVETFSLKALVGRAFRAPSPSELFGANTFLLASNIAQLRPESQTTAELAADWRALPSVNLRGNVFFRRLENFIGYSVSNFNLSTNLYSNDTAGLELELSAEASLRGAGTLGGFANYTYARLLSEAVADPTISQETFLTWVPEHVANAGVSYRLGAFDAALQAHLQGETRRRESDRLNPDFLPERPDVVGAWATLQLRAGYALPGGFTVGAMVRNVLDARAPLVKNNDYPFDYRSDGRRVMLTVDHVLR